MLLLVFSEFLFSLGLSSSVTLKFTVLEVDDEAPYFAEDYVAVVDPAGTAGQVVVVVSASDDDLDSTQPGYYEYALVDTLGLFEIVPNDMGEFHSGTVSLRKAAAAESIPNNRARSSDMQTGIEYIVLERRSCPPAQTGPSNATGPL